MNPPLAKDIMVTKLVTLPPDADVAEAIRVLVKTASAALPSSMATANYLGVFSEKCCMKAVRRDRPIRQAAAVALPTLPDARQIMSTKLVHVDPFDGRRQGDRRPAESPHLRRAGGGPGRTFSRRVLRKDQHERAGPSGLRTIAFDRSRRVHGHGFRPHDPGGCQLSGVCEDLSRNALSSPAGLARRPIGRFGQSPGCARNSNANWRR
jgi:hypothetical protein